jgi:hypothetical protein
MAAGMIPKGQRIMVELPVVPFPKKVILPNHNCHFRKSTSWKVTVSVPTSGNFLSWGKA